MNLYAYVGNDPVNLIDPAGLAGRLPARAVRNSLTGDADASDETPVGIVVDVAQRFDGPRLVAIGTVGVATMTLVAGAPELAPLVLVGGAGAMAGIYLNEFVFETPTSSFGNRLFDLFNRAE